MKYEETDDFSYLPQEKIGAVCAFCYLNGKFILVKNEGNWEPVAGHIEPGELKEAALLREVKEEANMNVIEYFPLANLYFSKNDFYMVQYLCLVEPYGDFMSDPDGGVTEIKMVDLLDIPKYFSKDDYSGLTLRRCAQVLENVVIDKNI